MSSSALFLSWSRPAAGRERVSTAHFDSFRRYLSELQARNRIESFEMVMLDGRPGHLNGFFLIQGDRGKLSELTQSDDWLDHMERAADHLDGSGPVWALTDELTLHQVAVPAKRVSSPFTVAEAS
ncbi:MAG TPA: hypothetical protein VM387_02190 [Gemmatimonadales bacterium]|nr:hypothetical protein [Gemmatimonadales bacterium]